MSRRALLLAGGLLLMLYGSFYAMDESPHEVLLFIAVQTTAFAIYAFLLFQMRGRDDAGLLGIIAGFAILFRLVLVLHDPVASDDIYRYVWDGKVAAHGINPFAYAPTDTALAHLRSEDLPAKINHPNMRTIYPPLAQAFFFLSFRLFGESVAGMKLLLVLADCISIFLISLLVRNAPSRASALLLYAWSPLPILYFALDGHIDALGISLLLLALFFVARSSLVAGATSLGLAALAKLYPLFVAPFLFFKTPSRRGVAAAALPFLIVLVGGWLYWEHTGGLLESFIAFNKQFSFNGGFFTLLYTLIGSNEKAHYASAMLFACWMMIVLLLKRHFVERVFLAFLGFLLVAPVVHPWYFCWLAVLLPFRWSLATFVLLGLSTLSNVTPYYYRLTGMWQDFGLVLLVEYLPVYLLLMRECVRGEFSASQHSLSLRA